MFYQSAILMACGVAATVLLAGCQAEQEPDTMRSIDLTAYRWRNRLLLVFARSRQDSGFVRHQALWVDQEEGTSDRDMVTMFLLSEEPGSVGQNRVAPQATADLRQRLDVPAEGFAVLLIGKDGGVKLRADAPVSPEKVFSLIDAMPMRREEMRRKNSSSER